MIEDSSRLRAAEYAIGAWALLALFGGSLSCWNGEFFWRGNANYEDPFAQYNAHPVIHGAAVAAAVVDAAIVIVVAFALVPRFWSPLQQRVMIVVCLAGSTFYFGEVDLVARRTVESLAIVKTEVMGAPPPGRRRSCRLTPPCCTRRDSGARRRGRR